MKRTYWYVTAWTWIDDEYEPVSTIFNTFEEADAEYNGLEVCKDTPQIEMWVRDNREARLLKMKD